MKQAVQRKENKLIMVLTKGNLRFKEKKNNTHELSGMVGNKRDLALSSLRHVRFPHSLTAGAIPFSSIPATAQGKRFSIFETGVRISEESEGIRWVKAATREREGHFLDLTSEVPELERSTHPARTGRGCWGGCWEAPQRRER